MPTRREKARFAPRVRPAAMVDARDHGSNGPRENEDTLVRMAVARFEFTSATPILASTAVALRKQAERSAQRKPAVVMEVSRRLASGGQELRAGTRARCRAGRRATEPTNVDGGSGCVTPRGGRARVWR